MSHADILISRAFAFLPRASDFAVSAASTTNEILHLIQTIWLSTVFDRDGYWYPGSGFRMISNKLSTNIPLTKNGEAFIGSLSSGETSTSVRVGEGDTISIHYTGRLDDGTVFISTESKEPFTFTQGQGEIVPVVQRAVVGMALGESKIVRVSEEEAYGAYHPELTIQVERAEFDKRGIKPEIGLEFGMDQTNGESLSVRVTEISDSSVTLDANHPLAGHAITFDLLLIDIHSKPAAEEERNT